MMATSSESNSSKEELRSPINVWVTKSKSLRILIFGKTGTGKSSLINTLFSEEVAKEGRGIYSETKIVKSYTKTITVIVNDVLVTLWDTPGLKDPYRDGKKTISEIQENCLSDVDLFVYCTRFDQSRLGQDDVDCIRDITKAFGAGIWKRALFALTCANEARVPISSQATLEEHFLSREKEWKEALRQVICEIKSDKTLKPSEVLIDELIPMVPTGYRDTPLPGDRQWFMDFWIACLMRVKFFSIPALIRVSSDCVNNEAVHEIMTRVIGQRLGGMDGEVLRVITPRLIGQLVADMGDFVDAKLKEEESGEENVSRVVDLLLEAIRNDQESIIARLSHVVGNAWARFGTHFLVAAGATAVTFLLCSKFLVS